MNGPGIKKNRPMDGREEKKKEQMNYRRNHIAKKKKKERGVSQQVHNCFLPQVGQQFPHRREAVLVSRLNTSLGSEFQDPREESQAFLMVQKER